MKKNSMALPATLLPLALAAGQGLWQGSSGQQAATERKVTTATAPNLNACLDGGSEKPGTPHFLANHLKRHPPAGGAPIVLTFEDFQALQKEADENSNVGEGQELDETQRQGLHQLAYSHGTVSEGDPVSISGFLTGRAHPNTGESVNCGLRGADNNDIHIPIAPTADGTEFEGIVTEMIPQGRLAQWNPDRLHKVQKQGLKVLVMGQLFYDNFHHVNDNPDDPLAGQPKRISLFEVHPITSFLICTGGSSCDETKADQWTPLEKWQPSP